MKKISSLLIIAVLAAAFIKCSKDDGAIDNNTSSTEFAPNNIVGNDLWLYDEGGDEHLYIQDFSSSNKCKLPNHPSSWYEMVITSGPSYTYSKEGSAKAKLKIKIKYESHTYLLETNYDWTEDISLSFTSSSEGTFTSSRKCINSGTTNGTFTYAYSGTFLLTKNSTSSVK